MVGVAIPWDSVWICNVAGLRDQETGTTIMDIEETMVMEDPAITAEDSAIILTCLKEEVTSRVGSSRTQSSFMTSKDNIMSQLDRRTRVRVVITFS